MIKMNTIKNITMKMRNLSEKKEESVEGVFALSEGDIKKLSSVRKTIAETSYGPKQGSENNGVHKSTPIRK